MGRYANFIKEFTLLKKIRRIRKNELSKLKRPSERMIIDGNTLSSEENKKIDEYFAKFRLRINHSWHLKYKTTSGNFHYDYFPEYFYNSDLKCKLNDPYYSKVYSNKYLLALLIEGSGLDIKTPERILVFNNGIYLDKDDRLLSREQAKTTLSTFNNIFVKKSIGTYGGADCILVQNNNQTITESIMNDFGSNYIVQKRIYNQDDIRVLNPDTLNTFRVITFFAGGEIHASPLVLRIGRKNGGLDNAHAGGMFVAVDDDGFIVSDAKNIFGDSFSKHPDTHISLKGFHIENVWKIKDAAIKLAALLPQTKLIDWDLALDQNGDVVCIEANIDSGSIWLIQMSHGKPVFGLYTNEMLGLIKNDSFLRILFRNIRR